MGAFGGLFWTNWWVIAYLLAEKRAEKRAFLALKRENKSKMSLKRADLGPFGPIFGEFGVFYACSRLVYTCKVAHYYHFFGGKLSDIGPFNRT